MKLSSAHLVAAAWFFAPAFSARADNWAPNLTMTATWQDNATNANAASDRIGALQTGADFLASQRYGVGRDDSFFLTAHLGAEWWPRFDGLTTGLAGARVEWRHTFGLGAYAPVFSVEAAGDAVAARESGRRGTATGVTAALRQRLTDEWRATLIQEFSQFYAQGAVFDRSAGTTALEIDRDLTDVTRLTFRASYRDGDIVSYGRPPRPDLVGLASHRLAVDTFGDSRVAYSIAAHTVGLKAGVTHALDQNSALLFSFEMLTTNRGSLSYVNHLVSLVLVHQY